MQTGQAGGHEAFTPQTDGVSVAVEFVGHLLVVGAVGGGGAEDDAAAPDQCLRCGEGADKGVQLLLKFRGQYDTRAKGTWHERPPCCWGDSDDVETLIMPHT